jgi:AraC-like DNA-binding protein
MRLYRHGWGTTAFAAAHEAGFGSYAQFHRVFRQETGRNPSALRSAAVDDQWTPNTDHPFTHPLMSARSDDSRVAEPPDR